MTDADETSTRPRTASWQRPSPGAKRLGGAGSRGASRATCGRWRRRARRGTPTTPRGRGGCEGTRRRCAWRAKAFLVLGRVGLVGLWWLWEQKRKKRMTRGRLAWAQMWWRLRGSAATAMAPAAVVAARPPRAPSFPPRRRMEVVAGVVVAVVPCLPLILRREVLELWPTRKAAPPSCSRRRVGSRRNSSIPTAPTATVRPRIFVARFARRRRTAPDQAHAGAWAASRRTDPTPQSPRWTKRRARLARGPTGASERERVGPPRQQHHHRFAWTSRGASSEVGRAAARARTGHSPFQVAAGPLAQSRNPPWTRARSMRSKTFARRTRRERPAPPLWRWPPRCLWWRRRPPPRRRRRRPRATASHERPPCPRPCRPSRRPGTGS